MPKKEGAILMSMNNEPVHWSEEKQKSLQEHLIGRWADDTWIFRPSNPKHRRRYMRFALDSPSLKTEIKYAIWSKYDTGKRAMNAAPHDLIAALPYLMNWLNDFTPPVQSLMEKTLEEWEISFRDYLIREGGLRNQRQKALLATQKYVEFITDDKRILLLRQLFIAISAAYDDRSKMDRDIWDMREMGLAVNLSSSVHRLNFTSIIQPWLRHLAKEYMKYNIAVNSPGDCVIKLRSIQRFSKFLRERDPKGHISASDIDRALIVAYIGFLRESKIGNQRRLSLLSSLRNFLETCACELGLEGVLRDRLIFNDDFPKIPPPQSREIPEGVLAQLREHLNGLANPILRMVVILLECGLRINELCSLPLDCLTSDDKQNWSLIFYQIKPKQEQIIPLVDETVINSIRAQQQSIREQWGTESPYLFPSIKSHLLPFKSSTFAEKLNQWALDHNICDTQGRLYHFQTHQFRHTVGMQLINDDVPIDVIGRLLGHRSLTMTEIYARKRDEQKTEDIERAGYARKTVNYQGRVIRGNPRANAPDAQLLRKGIRGQTLPLGGCGRHLLLGDCDHANKCLTCPSWLTSTEDLPSLRIFYSKAIHLKQRALEANNTVVLQNQDKIIPLLTVRINSLEEVSKDSYSTDELINQLRIDLVAAEAGLEEAYETGLIRAAKFLIRKIDELKVRIAGLEESY